MKSFKNSLIALLILTGVSIFAQGGDPFTKSPLNSEKKTPEMSDYLFGEVSQDYKIISSNSSYIEFEYYPANVNSQNFSSNGENFSVYEFQYGLDKSISFSGSPDLKYRSLSVFLPSERSNTVQVIDYDMKEEQNVNIAPVPGVKLFNPNIRSFENVIYTYSKSAEYSQNKYFPEKFVSLNGVGPLRDAVTGNVVIYPFQYNPVTKSIRYYSRIRVRITFGESPVMLSRPRSREEVTYKQRNKLQ